MAFEKITNLINQEMVFLEREATLVDSSLKRISIVLRDNPGNNLEDLANANIHEVVCAYIALNSNMTYDDAYACLRGLPEENELDTIKNVIDICDLEDETIDSVVKKVSIVSKRNKIKEEDYQKIKRIYLNDRELFKKVLKIWEVLVNIKDGFTSFNIAYDKDDTIEISGKNRAQIRKEYLYDEYDVDSVINFIRDMISICDIKKRQEKNINRNASRRITDYNTLMQLLASDKLEKVKYFDECLGYLNNSEMQRVFILEYQDYIKDRYQNVKEKYDTLVDNGDTRLKVLFNDYGLKFSELDEDTKKFIISINYDDVEKIMVEIKKLGIKDITEYAYLIVNSSVDIVNRFNTDIVDGLINRKYVLDHLNLLSKEKDNGLYFKHYLRVVTLIKEKNLNLRLFEYSSDIYGCNIELVNKNLNILDNYGLLGYLKNCSNFAFFNSSDLERRIDALLELGYENILVNKLDLLNYDYEIIKRLYAYKGIGEEVDNIEEVLETKEPIVPDEDLDSYIVNVADIETEQLGEPPFVEVSNANNSLTVNINGVLFSRNRVLRNRMYLEDKELTKEEKEYYSLILNGIYSLDELNIIKESYRSNDKRMI